MKSYRGVRPNGETIRIDFRYHNQRYVVSWPYRPIAANLAAANDKRQEVLAAIKLEKMGLGVFDIKKYFPYYLARREDHAPSTTPPTLAELFDDWWAINQAKLAASTRVKGYLTEFLAYFGGDLPITKLTAERIEDWIADQQKQVLSMKSIHNKLSVLRGALDFAKRRLKAIPTNPLADIDKIKPTEEQRIQQKLSKRKIDPFDMDEISAMLRAAAQGAPSPGQSWLHNMVQFGVWSGLRLGEVFALAWEDIDFVHHTAHVAWSYTERRLTPQKTTGSDRIIDLGELVGAQAALRQQKALTFMRQPIQTKIGPRRFVFINPATDAPFMHTEQLRVLRWPALLRRAGVRYRYPYQMRHTFASLMFAVGKSPAWVAQQMGHTDTEMVIRNYGHFLARADKYFSSEAGDRIAKLHAAVHA